MCLIYRTSRTAFFVSMFATLSTWLSAYLTTRLAHPFMFVARAFTWFTTVSPTADLAQAFLFVRSVSLLTFAEFVYLHAFVVLFSPFVA